MSGGHRPNEILVRLEAATPESPVTLGRYDVVGRVGRGGMGTVFEGVDRERRTRVALKTLLAADPASAVQIKREFRNVSELAHPHLAPVFELGVEEGLLFFAMERIDGVDLRRWARGDAPDVPTPCDDLPTRVERPLDETPAPGAATSASPTHAVPPLRPIPEVRRAFVELVQALAALHDAGLWHGDVKPGNVLVRDDGRVVVVDFGLARPVGTKKARGPTSGTPVYMAPEQLIGDDVGPSSDWYAVGTMLYELLTGRLPFGRSADASLVELYIRKTLQTPPSPRDLLAEIPEDLSELCMRLLRTDPTERPPREALAAILAGADAPPESVRTQPAPARARFVGRKQELAQLERAYDRARSGRCMVVHALGPSGIGKSATIRAFLGGVRDVDGAEIFRGRCFERESVPYKAFDGIVDELAARLVELGPSIATMLPAWIGELAQVFPALASVPAISARARSAQIAVLEPKELRRRAWIALRQLLEVMGRENTVVLWIDDLQWADADSAELLESFVNDARRMPMLVIASYRAIEASKNEALAPYFGAATKLAAGGDVVELRIEALSRAESQELARSMLESVGRRARDGRGQSGTATLAEEAAGVPLFIEELARYVASGAAADVHASLEEAIMARIRALSPEERSLVEMVAVAGSPVAQSVVFEATGIGPDALPRLVALRNASLVSATGPGADDLVYAYHDRIRESVVAALDGRGREERHLALARALAKRASTRGTWVFDAARHLLAASAVITDAAERHAAAKLHLSAAKAARSSAAFPLAFASFEGGVAFLDDDAWRSDYELALALYTGAAETAYLSAAWDTLDARAADVKRNGRTAIDRIGAWQVQIDALVGRHRYVEAVDLGMQALEQLGVVLPSNPTAEEVGAAVKQALERLGGTTPDAFAAMSDVDDRALAAAMRIQVRLAPAAFFGRPMLLPVIAANLVTTSVERGLSYATPYALALFGIVLNTMGLYPVSHAWGQLAVKLLERWEDRSLEAATKHVVHNLVCPWMVPLASILEPLKEVWDIGRRIGDIEYASYAIHGYVHNAMYAGKPLGPLVVEAAAVTEQMRALGEVNAFHVHRPFEQLLKCLTGQKASPSTLDDDTFDEAALADRWRSQGSRSGTFILSLVMGLVRYAFGEPKTASECFEIARAHLDAAPSTWHVPILHQYASLAACAAWDDLADDARAALRPKMEESLAALRTLAGHTPSNFAHRVSLVEGELRRIEGDLGGAFARFVEAAELAKEGAWVNDIALARELASGCQRAPAAKRASLEAARDGYRDWGATAKAAALDLRLASL